jgi:hypothetical protein
MAKVKGQVKIKVKIKVKGQVKIKIKVGDIPNGWWLALDA